MEHLNDCDPSLTITSNNRCVSVYVRLFGKTFIVSERISISSDFFDHLLDPSFYCSPSSGTTTTVTHRKVYSAFHPPGVGKWVPIIAGKAYVTAGRQLWLIPIADERVGMQVKLWDPLRTRAIPERFCGGDSLRRGAISSVCTFTFYLYYRTSNTNTMSWNVSLPHLSDL